MDRDKIIKALGQSVTRENSDKQQVIRKNRKPGRHLADGFKIALEQVGAGYQVVDGPDSLRSYIKEEYPEAISFIDREHWEEYQSPCSKEKLYEIGTVILEGHFGVSENGAVWLDDTSLPNRLIPFTAERLIICLDSKEIVSDMHDAYERISSVKTGFGVFISGPSKTADIEQHLVYGAHGPIHHMVVLY